MLNPTSNLTVSEVATEVALPGKGEKDHFQREFNSRGGPKAEKVNAAVQNLGNRGNNGNSQQATIARVMELAEQLGGVKMDALSARGGVWQAPPVARASEPLRERSGEGEIGGGKASGEISTGEPFADRLGNGPNESQAKGRVISSNSIGENQPVASVTSQTADQLYQNRNRDKASVAEAKVESKVESRIPEIGITGSRTFNFSAVPNPDFKVALEASLQKRHAAEPPQLVGSIQRPGTQAVKLAMGLTRDPSATFAPPAETAMDLGPNRLELNLTVARADGRVQRELQPA
jgi:hypothetical protein